MDMTSLMLWVRGYVTPTNYYAGLFLPAVSSLCVFNLLMSRRLQGRVEVVSRFNKYSGDDSYLAWWQKILLLIVSIIAVWAFGISGEISNSAGSSFAPVFMSDP